MTRNCSFACKFDRLYILLLHICSSNVSTSWCSFNTVIIKSIDFERYHVGNSSNTITDRVYSLMSICRQIISDHHIHLFTFDHIQSISTDECGKTKVN